MTTTHSPSIRYLLRLWFGLSLPVSRKSYLISGMVLMLFKFLVDMTVIHWSTGAWMSLFEYFSPLASSRDSLLRPTEDLLLWALALWTLPFMWIGISMSVRRAENAGKSPWFALFFFVPLVNYILIAYLASLPTKPLPPTSSAGLEISEEVHYISMMLKGAAVGVLLTLSMTALSVYVFGKYGILLFFGTPLIIGTVTAYIFNHPYRRTFRATAGMVSWSIFCASLAILLFALEGIVCIAMAFPIAYTAALLGAALGRYIATCVSAKPLHACYSIALLPLLCFGELASFPRPLDEVITSIEINASPEEVWPHVIGFSEIPAAPNLLLKSGIAYPIRARIEGSGVGAIRHCEFSTGAFVEPITVWEPPSRLAFDVLSQPPPMQEWSPYRHVHPPHLDGYFRSQRGEFRLKRTKANTTRLEGSTWYELDLYPYAYWRLWSRALIHQIHTRVLTHVKHEVEAGGYAKK